MNYDRILDKIFFRGEERLNKSTKFKYNRLKFKRYANIKSYIDNRYEDSLSERETLYRIHHNIEIRPVCKVCGGPVQFQGRIVVFSEHCSNRCKKLDPTVNEKWKKSCREKGTNRDKAKRTTLERYGYENAYQIPDVIEKIRQINKEKSAEAHEKQRQTCLEKYGVTNFSKTKEFKDKVQKTSLRKYGTKHPMQSDVVKNKYDWKGLADKCVSTKKKNGTINTSKPEDDTYELLLEVFGEVKRQYKTKEYPYYCDFYVPSIDTYIECQYGWTHGKRPYDPNDIRCIELLNKWKANSNSKYYRIAIDVWTRRDVEKRETATRNNLNFVEFWSLDEAKKWVENYKQK